MKNNILAGIGLLIVAGLGLGAWLLFQRAGGTDKMAQGTASPTSKATSSASPTPSISWKLYSNEDIGFSMRYPSGMEVIQNGEVVTFSQSGPSQNKDRMLSDGISLSVERERLVSGETVEKFMRAEVARRQSNDEEIIEQLHSVILGGYSGYEYGVDGLHLIAISPQEGELIRVSYTSEDPMNQGFAAIVKEMLDSFMVLSAGGK